MHCGMETKPEASKMFFSKSCLKNMLYTVTLLFTTHCCYMPQLKFILVLNGFLCSVYF